MSVCGRCLIKMRLPHWRHVWLYHVPALFSTLFSCMIWSSSRVADIHRTFLIFIKREMHKADQYHASVSCNSNVCTRYIVQRNICVQQYHGLWSLLVAKQFDICHASAFAEGSYSTWGTAIVMCWGNSQRVQKQLQHAASLIHILIHIQLLMLLWCSAGHVL